MFKSTKLTFLLLINLASLLCLLVSSGHTYFALENMGARAQSMGNAFTAVSGDSDSLYINPAGLAHCSSYELATYFSVLHIGLNAQSINGNLDSTGIQTIGIVLPSSENYPIFLGFHHFDNLFYGEWRLLLGTATSLFNFSIFDYPIELSVGANIKLLSWYLENVELTNIPTNQIGATGTFSLILKVNHQLSAGFSVDNIIPVNLGVTTEEMMPTIYRLGLAYQFFLNKQTYLQPAVDLFVRDNFSNNDLTYHMGLEASFFNQQIKARVGYNQEELTCGLGWDQFISAFQSKLSFNYVYSWPIHIDSQLGSHGLSLTFRLDPNEKEKLEAKLDHVAQQTKRSVEVKYFKKEIINYIEDLNYFATHINDLVKKSENIYLNVLPLLANPQKREATSYFESMIAITNQMDLMMQANQTALANLKSQELTTKTEEQYVQLRTAVKNDLIKAIEFKNKQQKYFAQLTLLNKPYQDLSPNRFKIVIDNRMLTDDADKEIMLALIKELTNQNASKSMPIDVKYLDLTFSLKKSDYPNWDMLISLEAKNLLSHHPNHHQAFLTYVKNGKTTEDFNIWHRTTCDLLTRLDNQPPLKIGYMDTHKLIQFKQWLASAQACNHPVAKKLSQRKPHYHQFKSIQSGLMAMQFDNLDGFLDYDDLRKVSFKGIRIKESLASIKLFSIANDLIYVRSHLSQPKLELLEKIKQYLLSDTTTITSLKENYKIEEFIVQP